MIANLNISFNLSPWIIKKTDEYITIVKIQRLNRSVARDFLEEDIQAIESGSDTRVWLLNFHKLKKLNSQI